MIKKSIITFLFVVFIIKFLLQFFYLFSNKQWLFFRTGLPMYQKSNDIHYDLKSSFIESHKTNEFDYKIITNEKSNRITEYEYINKQKTEKSGKISNIKTAYHLGPSYTFGWGVNYEESYTYLISKFLETKNYESINLSVPSMLPDLQLCKYLLKIKNKEINKPDLIIVTIYAGLGFDNISTRLTKDEQINYCKEINKKYIVTRGGYLVLKQDKIIDNLKIIVKNSALVFYTNFFFLSSQNTRVKNNLDINDLASKTNLVLKAKELELTINNYTNLVNQNNSTKIKLIFIFIPESWRINDVYLPRWRFHNIDYANVERSNKFIIDYLSIKFNIIDTTKDLQIASKINSTNYFFDTHLNQYGNRIVFNNFKKFYNEYIK
jgi:hypothetical protein